MPPFIGQAQIRPQNKLLELADLNQAFTGMRQASDRKIQYDDNQQQVARQNTIQDKQLKQGDQMHDARMQQLQSERVKSMAGLAQRARGNPQNWQNFLAADPEVAKRIPENIRSDPVAGADFIIGITQGYQDPMAKQQADATLDLTRAKIDGLRNPKQQDDQTNAIKEYQFARQDGFSGSFEDWMSRPKGQQLSVTDRKAILEADDMIELNRGTISALDKALLINDQAGYGYGAKELAQVGSTLGLGGDETLELDNIVTQQALAGLKATFGGAISEGEREILLEVAGSVNKAPQVRKKIFERARDLAQRRKQINADRASALRGGTYYQPQQPPAAQPPQQPTPPAPDGRVDLSNPQARQQAITEAEDAIRRGADPAAVRARLREMGVQ